jgi:phosphoribosylglycinamide formyltransferase-1
MARLRTAVFVSGRGSNLQALIDACADPGAPAEIALVLSNVPEAGGLARAEKAGIATEVVDHREFDGREPFEDALHAKLQEHRIAFLCLAGFMRILTGGFVGKWIDRAINIHPSLLPAYKGLHTHERVLADGVRFTGCTVHFVRPEMDDGPIIVQAAVPVHPGDTADTLAARVLAAEHECYPLALRLAAEGRLRIDGKRVEILGGLPPSATLINPAPEADSAAE